MKKNLTTTLLLMTLMFFSGCGRDANSPAFMFWCFRDEHVIGTYRVPDMKTPEDAACILSAIKRIDGHVDSSVNLDEGSVAVTYKSSIVRSMNFEEAIAMAGYHANLRPAASAVPKPKAVR